MTTIKVDRVIHRKDPYRASEDADAKGRRARRRDPERAAYFAQREVQNSDGSFPFGEGFLYEPARAAARDPGWASGAGAPGEISSAGHRGTKPQQQDAYGAMRVKVGDEDGAVLVVADGVSASGRRAARASTTAVKVFKQQLARELEDAPGNERQRHPFVERAIARAAFVANFEVIRQVLLDYRGDGRYDRSDRRRLQRETGLDMPAGRLTVAQMQRLAPQLDAAVAVREADGASALTTFAVAIAVDNDLYTFSAGDAVISLYRPSEARGKRLIQLTDRDQAVVELYKGKGDWQQQEDLYENVITDALGDSGELTGTLRRYPNLLEPGDSVIAHSDGLGPRDVGRGLDRGELEASIEQAVPGAVAQTLVDRQLEDLEPDEYQDNIGVVVLSVR